MGKERYRGFRLHCHLKSSDGDSHSTLMGAPNVIVTVAVHCTHQISGSQLGVIFAPFPGLAKVWRRI